MTWDFINNTKYSLQLLEFYIFFLSFFSFNRSSCLLKDKYWMLRKEKWMKEKRKEHWIYKGKEIETKENES